MGRSKNNRSIHDDKGTQFLADHFLDLASRSYQRNIPTYTDFLNLNEQNILLSMIKELPPVSYQFIGGGTYVERKIAAFYPSGYSPEMLEPPISFIKVQPVSPRFAEDLSHRDVLGSLMGLGINRSLTGDFLIGDGVIYLIVCERICSFILEQLHQIRNTSVSCSLCEAVDLSQEPNLTEITGTVASVRLDSLCSLAFGFSRSEANKRITGGTVFVNGRLITSNGYCPKEGDVISVRQCGRFIFKSQNQVTRKGRLVLTIGKYT